MPSFVEISPLVPEKRIFEGFLPYMSMTALIIYMPIDFHFLQMLHIKFGIDWPSGLREEEL